MTVPSTPFTSIVAFMKNFNVALYHCVRQKMENIRAIQSRQCNKVAQGLDRSGGPMRTGEVIANSASSAPDPQTTSYSPDLYEDEEATRQTEEFLASLMRETYAREDDGYLSSDDEPVRVFAKMITNDDLWILSDTASPSVKDAGQDDPKLGRGERISLVLPVIPATAHPTFWEMEHAKLQHGRDRFANDIPTQRAAHNESSSSTEPHYRASQSSSAFDDSYTFGKRVTTPPIPKEIPLSYVKAFASDLTTVADIDRHETLIYKEVRTPAAIRSAIKSAPRSVLSD
jgi:hypothetical protein